MVCMELSDKTWQIVGPLLPELLTGHRGRPWRENREVLDAILWVLRTGAPWRDLPKKYPSYRSIRPIKRAIVVFRNGLVMGR